MNCWLLTADGNKRVFVHGSDRRRAEVAKTLLERGGPGKRPLHWDLLIEQHAE